MRKYQIFGLLGLMFFLSACDDDAKLASHPTSPPSVAKKADVAQGAALYTQHCGRCHGVQGVGAPQWDIPGADGKFPPPPLDGNGRAWHYSSTVLRDIIMNGSKDGKGAMPAWKDKLSLAEIDLLIVWMQSLWPADIYNGWLEVEGHTQP
ncbi:MAG: cytochrome c [Gammaproteobacteria bacterium]|nr:cytochrome c [Gammaproteobacteria bacterium]